MNILALSVWQGMYFGACIVLIILLLFLLTPLKLPKFRRRNKTAKMVNREDIPEGTWWTLLDVRSGKKDQSDYGSTEILIRRHLVSPKSVETVWCSVTGVLNGQYAGLIKSLPYRRMRVFISLGPKSILYYKENDPHSPVGFNSYQRAENQFKGGQTAGPDSKLFSNTL